MVGQIIFGAYFLYQGFNHFYNHKALAGYAKFKGIPAATPAVVVTGILLFLGGLGIALNTYVDISAVLLLAFLIPTTFTMHAFWSSKDPATKMNEQIAFLKNIALIGAVLMFL